MIQQAKFIVFIFGVLVVGGCGTTAHRLPVFDDNLTSEQMVLLFDSVVFESEFEDFSSSAKASRWQSNFSVKVLGESKPRTIDDIKSTLSEINLLTGLETVEKPFASGEIQIVLVNEDRFASVKIPQITPSAKAMLSKPMRCYYVAFRKPAHRITAAVIVINIDLPENDIKHCIAKHLVQAMGLVNDSRAPVSSVLSDGAAVHRLSRIDKILLRALYDDRLPITAERDAVLKALPTILHEWDERVL